MLGFFFHDHIVIIQITSALCSHFYFEKINQEPVARIRNTFDKTFIINKSETQPGDTTILTLIAMDTETMIALNIMT